MIYLRNRYYDPENARFITEDPIRDGLNWYVYARNNPVMFVDPTGLGSRYVRVFEGLNFRSKADINSGVISTLPYGTEVE